jgi:hypothetical protein
MINSPNSMSQTAGNLRNANNIGGGDGVVSNDG